jgi:hypothetical protein
LELNRTKTGSFTKSTPTGHESLEENGPVDPVESIMMEACKNGYFSEIHHCQYAIAFNNKITVHCTKGKE